MEDPVTIGKTPKRRGRPKSQWNKTRSQVGEMESEDKSNMMSRLLEAEEPLTNTTFDSMEKEKVFS